MKKLILTMAAIAIVGCNKPTTPQQACAYYEANSCNQTSDKVTNKPWPFVGWYCGEVLPICNNYLYEIAQTEKNKRLTLVTNQLNTDKVLNVIVQQSINHGAICRQDSGNAYCLAIDLRSKQLSEVTISSSEYQQVLRNLNAQADESKAQAKAKADERTARAQANKEALEILNKAESKRK